MIPAYSGGMSLAREPDARPIGRERIVRVTEARLRAGQEVRVADICAEADVSPALIYKYFADREDLIAEAYARIFAGFAREDIAAISSEIDLAADDVEEQLARFMERILDPARDSARWARLEALAHGRTNPGVAARIGAVREQLVDELAGMALAARPGWDATHARAFATIALGMPIGVTAMASESLEPFEREAISRMWARLLAAPFRA